MKKVVLLLTLMCLSVSAQARVGEDYWLVKAGAVNVQERDSSSLGVLGALYGYNLSYRVSAEVELLQSVAGGHYQRGDGEILLTGLLGGIAYRHELGSIFYSKARLGALLYHVEYSKDFPEPTDTTARLVPSIGLGMILHDVVGKRLITEIDLNYLSPSFQSYLLSIGVKF